MSSAIPSSTEHETLWPTEWWERTRQRRQAWIGRHAPACRTLATGRTVLLFGAVIWLVVAAIAVPELRAGIGAWVGVFWIGVVGFLAMRTKTLSWASYWWLFTVALGWSLVFGLLLRALAQSLGSSVEGAGAAVAIASLGEESLKLAPLAAIALLAPARVHRFALADWLLAGLACGAAFMAVEEALRRVLFAAESPVADELPFTFTTFGVLGADPGYSSAAYFPGHHVASAFVAVAIGLGVLLARRSRRHAGPWRVALLVLAVAVPALTWWSAVVAHAALNAQSVGLLLPWPMRVWDSAVPGAWGTAPWVVLVGVLVLLVDARRLSRWADASFEADADPAWVTRGETAVLDAQGRADDAAPVVRAVAAGAASTGLAAVRLSHVVVRDVRQLVQAHSSRMGTKQWAGARAARTLVVMQREMRQIAYHLDGGPTRLSRTRVLALAALVALLLAALVVAPLLARSLDAPANEPGISTWLAGLLARFGSWWGGLSAWQQVAAGLGAVSLGALSAASLGPAGDDTDHPFGSLATLTPIGAIRDLGQAGLTFGLGGREAEASAAGTTAGSGLHALAADYRADPTAWRGARAEQLARSAPPGR